MKMSKLAAVVAGLALLLFISLPNLSWAAEDGAALYKAKCSACHGLDAAGKPAAKIPAVKGKTPEQVKTVIDAGGKHAGVKSSLKPEQVQAIGDYLKALK